MASPDRAKLIANAVSFLKDQHAQQAPLEKRVEFLKAKGLRPDEIDIALRDVGITRPHIPETTSNGDGEYFAVPTASTQLPPPSQPTYMYTQPTYIQDPRDPRLTDDQRTWKDWFVTAVISGTVMVGAYSVAKKYLFPHLTPPPLDAFQQTQASLEAQFDLVSKQLDELTLQSAESKRLADAQREQVDRTLAEVEKALKEVQESEEKMNRDLREIKEEVATVKDLVPKLVQASQASATDTLSDVQQELRSLKTLLLSRPTMSGAAFPSSHLPFGAGSTPGAGLLSGRPSIPAWQLAATKSPVETPIPSDAAPPQLKTSFSTLPDSRGISVEQ